MLTWCCGSMSYRVSRTLLRMRLTVGVCRELCCARLYEMHGAKIKIFGTSLFVIVL